MAQNINDNLRLHAPKLLDDRAGPYASVAAALAGIPAYQRVEGLEVIIEVGGVQKKYWFDGGVADVDLVEIPSGGSGGYEPKNSIEVDADELQLVGDEASPGNNKVYGTDGAGAKGWKDDPAGGGHTIIDPDGNAMTQRTGLQFEGDVELEDDELNDITKVNVLPLNIEDKDEVVYPRRSKLQIIGDAEVYDDEPGDTTIINIGVDEYKSISVVANEIEWDCSVGLRKLAQISSNTTVVFSNLVNGMHGYMKLDVLDNNLSIDFNSGVTMFLHGDNELLQQGVYRIFWHFGATMEIVIFPYVPYSTPGVLEFTSVWDTSKTSAGSSTSTQVKLPLVSTGVYNFIVDWGDGNTDTITVWNQAETTHTYLIEGIYTIRITGQIEGFRFDNGGDRLKLHNVANWGPLKLTTDSCFYGCSNFASNAEDYPVVTTTSYFRMFRQCAAFNGDVSKWNTVGVLNMYEAFYGCTVFNQNIGGWDMSSVQTTRGMFWLAIAFNQNIGDWDMSSVETTREMFSNATAFNQNIGGWDVGAVTDMTSMFRDAKSFNQNIGGWNVSAVTSMVTMFSGATAFNNNNSADINNWVLKNSGSINMASMFFNAKSFNQNIGGWNVSAVTSMYDMFRGATAFNQNIGGWNVSAVTNMFSMFRDATAFNQNIGSWDVGAVTNMANMFIAAALSNTNYNNILVGWTGWTGGAATKSLQNSVAFHAGTAKYSTGDPADARAWLVDTILNGGKAWSITDGGAL